MAGLQRAATLTSGSNVIDLTGSDFEDDEEDLLSMPVVRSPVKIKSESTKLAEAPKRGRVNAEEEKTRMAINGGAKSVIMHLRQIANHPWLADPTGGPKEDEERREGLVGLSGKVMLLARLLERVFAAKGNSKVLVFSQFTSALDLISEWAGIRGYEHLQLDGDNRPEQEDIDEFNRVDSTGELGRAADQAARRAELIPPADVARSLPPLPPLHSRGGRRHHLDGSRYRHHL